MKIVIEITGQNAKPSQGRNEGSIPSGSTIADGFFAIGLVPGRFYRAQLEVPEASDVNVNNSDEPDEVFVCFVGWDGTADRAIFERGDGQFFIYTADKIEVGS